MLRMLAEQSVPAFPWAYTRYLQGHLFFLLQYCCKTARQLSQIHAHMVFNGFTQKNFIFVKLLALYVAFNNLPHALQVFDRLRNPSTAIFNQIIKGNALSGDSRKSVQLLNRMGCSVVLPDGYTYNYVINGCAKGGMLEEGEQVHGKALKSGFCSNVFVRSSLVDFYVKSGGQEGLGKAWYLFDEMGEINVVTWNSLLLGCIRSGDIQGAKRVFKVMPWRNVVSWTTMIAGCTQNGRCKEALLLFSEMRQHNIEFDQVTLVTVLSACAELGDLNLGRWIHSYVVESVNYEKHPVLVSLNNALIHMYASCSEIEAAFRVFNGMEHRTIVSWTSMITGFAKHGYGDEALSVFKWMESMQDNDVRPDEITFLGVLCACSHSGYVEVGRHYFKTMTEIWKIEPSIQHFGCMVDLLSRAGFLDEAYELVKSMPMRPNNAVWGALLGGCSIYKNVELASDVSDWFTEELDPDQASGYLVLLSNVFAANERWQDVVTVRQKMLDIKTRKPPGRSWIQIEGSIYEFLVGDRSNEHAYLIYEVLDDITKMFDLLSRAGFLDEAYELVKSMPMMPNNAVWGALLGGCRIYKNVKLASDVSYWFTEELDPGQASGYLVRLSNVFAAEERWHDVVTVRQKMLDIKTRKPPGRSWIQIEGSVYEFLVGDRSNEHACLIYEVLDDITKVARLQGCRTYVADALPCHE